MQKEALTEILLLLIKDNGGLVMARIKILVVDDEARMRKLIKDFLQAKGFSILEAEDGEKDCIDYFRRHDAKNGWMAGSAYNKRILSSTNYYADGKRRRKR